MNKIEFAKETNGKELHTTIIIGRSYNKELANTITNEMHPTWDNEVIYLVIDKFEGDELDIKERYHWSSGEDCFRYGISKLRRIIIDNNVPHETYLANSCIGKVADGLWSIKEKDLCTFPLYSDDEDIIANTRTRAILYSALLCSEVKRFDIEYIELFVTKPAAKCYKGRKLKEDMYLYKYDRDLSIKEVEAEWIIDMIKSEKKMMPYPIEAFGVIVPMRTHKYRTVKNINKQDVYYGDEYVGCSIDITPEQEAVIVRISDLPSGYTIVNHFISDIVCADFRTTDDDSLAINLYSQTQLDSEVKSESSETEIDPLNKYDKKTKDIINSANIVLYMNDILIECLEERVSELSREIARLKEVTEHLRGTLPEVPVITNSFGVAQVSEPVTDEELKSLLPDEWK